MLAGDACAEPRAAAFALLEQTSAVSAALAIGAAAAVTQMRPWEEDGMRT